MTWLDTILLSIVEGISEFLPISSTGHMIVTSYFLGIQQEAFVKTFTVVVQLGAILAVVVLYWRKFFQISFEFYKLLVIASLPAALIGLAFEKLIDRALGSIAVVIFSMISGGLILIGIDRWIKPPHQEPKITVKKSFVIGMYQCIAMIPGVSRSASTIIGGLMQGLTRPQAAEFSFLMSVPVMFGATLLKLIKYRQLLNHDTIEILLIGNIIAFVVALVVIKMFITYLTKHGLKVFGYYRIIFGLLLIGIILLRSAHIEML